MYQKFFAEARKTHFLKSPALRFQNLLAMVAASYFRPVVAVPEQHQAGWMVVSGWPPVACSHFTVAADVRFLRSGSGANAECEL